MNQGCFVYLIDHRNAKAISLCLESLRLLNANYLDSFPSPIIIFHEAGLTDALYDQLQRSSRAPLLFEQIPFERPAHISDKDIMPGQRVGYMNMCRFYGNEIFKQPILDDFRYYCRLDTDSFIRSPVHTDLFDDMCKSDAVYGFINDSIRDKPQYCTGLWQLAASFIAANPSITTYANLYTDIPERRVFYTNFEVCDIAWFRGATWQMFFKAIDTDGGIYRHRWGDHTIRYIGVNAFLPKERIKRIKYIHYCHQGIEDNRPNGGHTKSKK